MFEPECLRRWAELIAILLTYLIYHSDFARSLVINVFKYAWYQPEGETLYQFS